MKTASIIFLSLLLIGCGTIPDSKEEYIAYGYNFNKYVNQGFVITPEEYRGDYDVMGILDCTVKPEIVKDLYNPTMLNTKLKDGTRYYYISDKGDFYRVKTINTDSLISYMYRTALDLNADGIMRFKVVNEPMKIGTWELNIPHAYGVAIKRKKL